MEALGYVECNGLSSATVAADRMLKTSDIKLNRIQNAQNGWITLEFKGDIAALKVAVETIKRTLPERYIAGLVIGSPSKGLDDLGSSGACDIAPKNFNPEKYNTDGSIKEYAVFGPHKNKRYEDNKVETSKQVNKDIAISSEKNQSDSNNVTCNLCGDPNCPRKLGEPHKNCIHYDDNDLKE